MRHLKKNYRTEDLSDTELSEVSGELNPQPLPPRTEDTHFLKISDNGYRLPAIRFF